MARSGGSTASRGSATQFSHRADTADRRDQGPRISRGPQGYSGAAKAMAEQWRELLALVICYAVIGAYWLGTIIGPHLRQDRSLVRRLNLLFLLAIVVVPYPIRVWCFHLGSPFEPVGPMTLVAGLALTAGTWMAKWFYGMPGRRLMDERLAPDFLRQMTRRYGLAAAWSRSPRFRPPSSRPASEWRLRSCAWPSSSCRSPSRATSRERGRAGRRKPKASALGATLGPTRRPQTASASLARR